MKKLLGAVAAMTFATSALASGPALSFGGSQAAGTTNWSGLYVGVGPVYSRSSPSDTSGGLSLPTATGLALGALGGYNWQSGNFVYGVETALVLGTNSATSDCGLGGANTCRVTIDSFWSVRGRAGVGFDRTLVFGTLGYSVDQWALGVPGGSASIRYSGLTLGIGAEQAVSDTTSFRADVEHYRFGTRTNAGGTPVRLSTTLLRLSVMQRF